nr:hypothetical protein [Streptomyces avermitilis]
MAEGPGGGLHRSRPEDVRQCGGDLACAQVGGGFAGLSGLRLREDPRSEQQHPGATGLVGFEVQPLGGGHTADRVRVDEGGQVVDNAPVLAELPLGAALVDVADGHPLLERGQVDAQRPYGQRLHTPAAASLGVAAGEPGGGKVDGLGDGDAAPVGDLDPRLEARSQEALGHLGDHEVGALLVGVPLDEERQEGDLADEGLGEQVVGVQVPDRVEDLRHLGVEHPLRWHVLRRLSLQTVDEQPKALDRVHRVHRGLERQVDVVLLQQDQRLGGDESTLVERQRSRLPQEGGQVGGGRQVLAHRLGRVRDEIGNGPVGFVGHRGS